MSEAHQTQVKIVMGGARLSSNVCSMIVEMITPEQTANPFSCLVDIRAFVKNDGRSVMAASFTGIPYRGDLTHTLGPDLRLNREDRCAMSMLNDAVSTANRAAQGYAALPMKDVLEEVLQDQRPQQAVVVSGRDIRDWDPETRENKKLCAKLKTLDKAIVLLDFIAVRSNPSLELFAKTAEQVGGVHLSAFYGFKGSTQTARFISHIVYKDVSAIQQKLADLSPERDDLRQVCGRALNVCQKVA